MRRDEEGHVVLLQQLRGHLQHAAQHAPTLMIKSKHSERVLKHLLENLQNDVQGKKPRKLTVLHPLQPITPQSVVPKSGQKIRQHMFHQRQRFLIALLHLRFLQCRVWIRGALLELRLGAP